jgi:hypothetical protein
LLAVAFVTSGEIMDVSNGNDDNNADTIADTLSSPPPSADPVDAAPIDETLGTSSSPDRRSNVEEHPIIIAPEFLPTVMQVAESLGPRRVKVYELRGEVWVDLGTGFCQGLLDNVISPTQFVY